MSTHDADLIVWDSTPAGLTAAVAAAQAGLRVLIVTEDQHLGGLQTSGLGCTNAGQVATIGGLTRQFHQRVLQHYLTHYGAQSSQVRDCRDGLHFEPHVAERIWEEWLAQVGAQCVRGQVITHVERQGAALTVLHTQRGSYRGRVFLDASYEGDLLALAGCAFHLGREAQDTYGETLAGATYPPAHRGRGDHKLQPFDYRCCLTDVPRNRVPFAPPPGYDPVQYAWFHARLMQIENPRLLHALPLNPMPNCKTDSRTAEWPGHSWDYITTDRPGRAAIELAHRHYSAGYLWFLVDDPSVPAAVRQEAAQWGLAKDEFTDNDHWPWHIYVREGRRLIGEYVMTQRDCLEDRQKPDSIGLCSWCLDVHPVEIFEEDGVFHPDGLIFQAVRPFEIPWRSVLPRRAQASNLLVPTALSASHVAFSAIRVEPVWMILGEACGLGAALALQNQTSLHDLPTASLREQLAAQGQVLDASGFPDFWPK